MLLDQAALLIDTVYVHRLNKQAMYAVEPTQRLRLLRHRLARMTDVQFHAELLRIFVELRDLHTNYVLPRPYQGPFAVRRCSGWRDSTPTPWWRPARCRWTPRHRGQPVAVGDGGALPPCGSPARISSTIAAWSAAEGSPQPGR
jgi:hypothetical protein